MVFQRFIVAVVLYQRRRHIAERGVVFALGEVFVFGGNVGDKGAGFQHFHKRQYHEEKHGKRGCRRADVAENSAYLKRQRKKVGDGARRKQHDERDDEYQP